MASQSRQPLSWIFEGEVSRRVTQGCSEWRGQRGLKNHAVIRALEWQLSMAESGIHTENEEKLGGKGLFDLKQIDCQKSLEQRWVYLRPAEICSLGSAAMMCVAATRRSLHSFQRERSWCCRRGWEAAQYTGSLWLFLGWVLARKRRNLSLPLGLSHQSSQEVRAPPSRLPTNKLRFLSTSLLHFPHLIKIFFWKRHGSRARCSSLRGFLAAE